MIEIETDWIIVIIFYLLLLLTSGFLVSGIFRYISKKTIEVKVGKEARDTGFVIGKCENILILTFILVGGYTALALIFAAKTLVRKEDMSKNSLYFLAGTLVNFTYSLIVGVIMLWALDTF